MSSNNLRFLFNLQRSGLIYQNATIVRLNSTKSFVNYRKLTRNVNNIRLIQQTRLETTNAKQKPTNGGGRSFKILSKYLIAFMGGVFGYYGIMMYIDFFEDKADTSPKALKYKPGLIEQVSKKVLN
jgi:hypothetical protein